MENTQEEAKKINILIVEPERHPMPAVISDTLEAEQGIVGGMIEAVYPFEDPVAIVCNEEGKINGMPLNRALRDESGKIYDVLSGTFFICGLTDDSFGSLSPEMMQKYEKFFHCPEVFMRMGNEIRSFMVPDREPKDKDAAEKTKAVKQKKDSRDVL